MSSINQIPLYVVLFFILFPLSVGLIYGMIERLVRRWLKNRGWQTGYVDVEGIGWESEFTYN
jgi:NhaP-type Na+/H+ or K+/H+ antiporter